MEKLIRNIAAILFLSLALSLNFFGCGGGGGGGSETSSIDVGGTSGGDTSTSLGTVLTWDPPATFTDQSSLDPASDLSQYEIYVNSTGVFSDADEPSAVVSAVDSSGDAVTSFDLLNLPFTLSPDVTYYVSMKSVSSTSLSSDFAPTSPFKL